jgi:hypothetical protein
MAVIARAEEIPDEIPPPRRTKAAMAPNTLSGAGEQSVPPVTGGSGEQMSGPSDDQAEGAVGGSATDDSGYAQMALVMATFAKDMRDSVHELRQEVLDLRPPFRFHLLSRILPPRHLRRLYRTLQTLSSHV